MVVYFYTPDQDYGAFSNFARFGVAMDGVWWPTVEHYFQAQKFEDAAYRNRIRGVGTAKQAAELGRSRKLPIRADWDTVKVGVMRAAVLKKFQTHDEIRLILLATGNAEIVENAPGDYFWGCGQDGSGMNWLGRILIDVRAELAGTL